MSRGLRGWQSRRLPRSSWGADRTATGEQGQEGGLEGQGAALALRGGRALGLSYSEPSSGQT